MFFCLNLGHLVVPGGAIAHPHRCILLLCILSVGRIDVVVQKHDIVNTANSAMIMFPISDNSV